jgi:hypothetical protein
VCFLPHFQFVKILHITILGLKLIAES